jgi:hypothetical protein
VGSTEWSAECPTHAKPREGGRASDQSRARQMIRRGKNMVGLGERHKLAVASIGCPLHDGLTIPEGISIISCAAHRTVTHQKTAGNFAVFAGCLPQPPQEPKAPTGVLSQPLFTTCYLVGEGGFEPPTPCLYTRSFGMETLSRMVDWSIGRLGKGAEEQQAGGRWQLAESTGPDATRYALCASPQG